MTHTESEFPQFKRGMLETSRDAWRDLAVALIDHWTPRDDSLWNGGESLRRIINAYDELAELGESVDAIERNIREAQSYETPDDLVHLYGPRGGHGLAGTGPTSPALCGTIPRQYAPSVAHATCPGCLALAVTAERVDHVEPDGLANVRLREPWKAPRGFACCNVYRDRCQTSHLVMVQVKGFSKCTPGPTLCGLSRFDEHDPETNRVTRKADLPGWSINGGVSGGGIVQVACESCWVAAALLARSL